MIVKTIFEQLMKTGAILNYGHQLAEECPEDFARVLDEFFSN